MGVLNIDSVNLGPSIVTPTSGNTYTLNNLAYDHWLDNAYAQDSDGNPILSWYQNVPETTNQEVCRAYTVRYRWKS